MKFYREMAGGRCGLNMKKVYNLTNNHHKDGQDKSKKIYRLISDNVKRLDDARGCANIIAELFTIPIVIQRTKLKDYCERLIFSDPAAYGLKAEELLWRKVYYDVISTAKRLKGNDFSLSEKYDLITHINGGIGYYHHFVSKVLSEFSLELDDKVDFFIEKETKTPEKQEVLEWANSAVQRSLIYLGDLNRYKLDLSPHCEPYQAFYYYTQALTVNPNNGMPHNQMGTLSSQNLDAAYHYIQCLMCKNSFEGAENNLYKLFERNSEFLEQLPPVPSEAIEPSEQIKLLTGRFLLLTDIWFCNKKIPHVYELCHKTNVELQECLSFSRPILSESGGSQNGDSSSGESFPGPAYLSPDAVNKMIVICLLCITKLQNNRNSSQVSNVVAFTLAVYSILVQHVFNHIQEGILNYPLPDDLLDLQIKRKCIRRRRVNETGTDDEEESDVDFADSDAETIPNSLSETESEEAPEELTCVSSSSDDEDVIVESAGDSGEMEKGNKDLQSPKEILKKAGFINSNDLIDIISDEDYLPCVKILSDWLVNDTEVLRSCGKSARSLFLKVSNLLNLLNVSLGKITDSDLVTVNPTSIESDFAKIPLPEDFLLKNLDIVKESQKELDWGYFRGKNATNKDNVVIRMSKLIAFGRFAEQHSETGINYDPKYREFCTLMIDIEDSFLLKMPNYNEMDVFTNGELHGKVPTKGELMEHMGQLWLAAEVKELETRVKGKMSLSPYLVIDVDTLIKYMFIVKSLIYSRKFIVLVPSAVLSALDDLKKEKPEAREAIRWLEAQFNRGNRFFRAQRAQERLPLPFIKYPKKKDKESFIYVQIIECCHYLAEQQKQTTNIVTLLMGDPNALLSTENREISYVGLAQSAGVNLELITEFYAKWKKPVKGKR